MTTKNNRTKNNLLRMLPSLLEYSVIYTKDLRRDFYLSNTTALRYIRLIPLMFPDQFELVHENGSSKSSSILALYPKKQGEKKNENH